MTRAVRRASVSRRALLAGMAGAGALFALPGVAFPRTGPDNEAFRHGVASGDPDADSVVIWTRVTGQGEVKGVWETSATPDFALIVSSGSFATDAARDHTVKALLAGLGAGATIYYRFRIGEAVSPVGRARTLPQGHLDRLGIALASCSNYAFGYFNAYQAIARDAEVDFVLHTGDYLYEYGGHDGWGAPIAHKIGRVQEPPHEIVSLADYRVRHAQYKTDAGAMAMHAAHTLLACWDDHESANNPWTGGAQNHQPETEGSWTARREASIRAYFEWLPVREPEWLAHKGRSRAQFWREYSFGDLALLHTLETRHTARARQIDYSDYAEGIIDKASAERFRKDVLGQPGRRMLAPELEADLSAALARSKAEGQPWRIIGCPMVIARIDVPDVAGLGILPDPFQRLAAARSKEDRARLAMDPAIAFAWKGHFNLPDYLDAWGGYPWAREQLYGLARKAGANDLVFLSGDSHSFWVNRLADEAGRSTGIEFGTAGISSPGDFIDSGFAPDVAKALDRAYADHIPEVVWTDNMHQGYVRIEFGRDRGEATFVAVDTVLSPRFRTSVLHRAGFAKQADGTVALV